MADMTVAVAIIGEDKASTPIKAVTTALGGLEQAAAAPLTTIGNLTHALGAIGLASMGIQAITSSVGGLADAIGLGLNAELEDTEAQLRAFTGSSEAARDILAQIREEADKTPFAFKEMANATASLLPASKASGVGLMELVKQAEVLAALHPEQGLEGAAFALREATGGDFTSVIERFDLPRQRINELKAQGVPAIKAIQTALKEMGADEKLVANLAGTMHGRWSTLQDTIAGFRARLGKGVFDALSEGLVDAQAVLDDYKDALGDLAQTLGSFLGGAARGLVRWAVGLARTGGAVLRFFQDATNAGVGFHNMLERAFGARTGNVLIRAFEGLRDTLRDVGGLLRGEISIGDFAKRLGQRIVDGIKTFPWAEAASAVVAGMSKALSAARDAAGGILGWLRAQVGAINWAQVWAQATTIGSGFVQAGLRIAGEVATWLGQQWAAIQWATVWARATEIGSGLVQSALAIAGDVATWLGTQWANIDWPAVWHSVTAVANGLIEGLGQVWGSVTSWLTEQWAKIDWPAIWTTVTEHGTTLVDNLATITSNLQEWLVEQVTGVDWDTVWTEGGAGQRASESFADLLDRQDARPAGAAVGRFVAKVIKFGVGIGMGLTGGGWDQASEIFSEAFQSSVVKALVSLVTFVPRQLGLYLFGYWVDGLKEFLGLKPEDSLRAALVQAIRGVFPITIGPLTIGLGGVTVRIGPATVPVAGAGAEETPGTGLVRTPGNRDIYGNQRGGLYRVGGVGGTDSQLVSFRATPGEMVAVGHARGGGGDVHINAPLIHVERMDGGAAQLEPMLNRVRQFLVEDIRVARGQGVPRPAGVTPRGSR